MFTSDVDNMGICLVSFLSNVYICVHGGVVLQMGVSGMDVAYRSHSRVNGWSLPLHPFQFIAWLFLLFFGLMHFLVLVPAVLMPWQPVAYAVSFHIIVCLYVAKVFCDQMIF